MSREELIALCDRGVVSQDKWSDRDSAGAQRQLAECRALLLAGCDFAQSKGVRPKSDDSTIWVDVMFHGFQWFECDSIERDLFYVPTAKRLDEADGGDWY